MEDIAIRVENLSKQYRIGDPQERYKTLRDTLTDTFTAPFRRLSSVVRGQPSVASNETIWALKDVSFEVERRREEIARQAAATLQAVREGRARYGSVEDLKRDLLAES